MSFQGFLSQWKDLAGSGLNEMGIAAFIVKSVDKENRVSDLLNRIKAIHIKLSLASLSVLYLLKVVGHWSEIMQNHVFFVNAYDRLCQKFFENGVRQVTNQYREQFEQDQKRKPVPKQTFFQLGRACELSIMNPNQDPADDDDSKLDPDELSRRKANAWPNLMRMFGMKPTQSQQQQQTDQSQTAQQQQQRSDYDPHFIGLNDVSFDNVELTDEERETVIKDYEFKLKMLQSRYEKLIVDIQDFHQTFASDPQVLQLIQNANPRFFEDPTIIQKISWFNEDNFVPLIRRGDEMIEKKDFTFQNITMFWNAITYFDDVEYQKACSACNQTEKTLPRDQVEQHRPTFWYNLNNCILLSTLVINIRDSEIEEFFKTLRNIYDMFLAGELKDFKDFYTRLLINVRRIFPNELNDKGRGLPSEYVLHFLFQAATSNIGFLTAIVKEIKYAAPDWFKEFIKNTWGHDIDAFNLSRKMREQCLNLLSLKPSDGGKPKFLEILEHKQQEAIRNQTSNQQDKNTNVHKLVTYLASSQSKEHQT